MPGTVVDTTSVMPTSTKKTADGPTIVDEIPILENAEPWDLNLKPKTRIRPVAPFSTNTRFYWDFGRGARI
jgi:hypothetical protein